MMDYEERKLLFRNIQTKRRRRNRENGVPARQISDTKKMCPSCLMEKDFSEFYKSKHMRLGARSKCIACEKSYKIEKKDVFKRSQLAWREKNKEKYLAYQAQYRRDNPNLEYAKAYREANPELCRQRVADWAKRNADRKAAQNAAWMTKNPERKRTTNREWLRNNRDKGCAYAARYRATKMQACPSWADLDKIALLYVEAQQMTSETGVSYHVDHIVPLQSKWVCGLHVEYNLRITTKKENCSKSNRHWPGMYKDAS